MVYLYPDLAPKFCKCVPDFSDLSLDDQSALVKMFWQCVVSPTRSKQTRYDLSAHIPSAKIKDIWGSLERMKAVVSYKFFSCEPGSNLTGRASLFTPCREFVNAYRCYVLTEFNPRLLSASGNQYTRQKHGLAVASKTSDNNRRHGRGQPCPDMPVDRNALLSLLDQPICSSCEQATLKLLCLSNGSESKGCIPMRYVQKSFGRLYDCHGIQSIPRSVRSTALKGKFDYDIENCHISILAALAEELHLSAPTIQHYLSHKNQCRLSLAEYISTKTGRAIDLGCVKAALIALVYGAQRSTSSYAGLADVISDEEQRRAFVHNDFVISLSRELDACRSKVVERFRTNGGWITNALGIRKHFEYDQIRSALSFILTGIESKALDAILQRWGSAVILCMHDGWVMNEEVPVEEFEAAILNRTGYRLKVECSVIDNHSPCKNCCAPRSKPNNHNKKQWVVQNSGIVLKTNGACGCGLGLAAGGGALPGRSGLVISARPRWNLPPDFQGVFQKVGRPPRQLT